MKRYVFEADKHLHEKTREPKYIFTPHARIAVYAENDDEALEKARAGLDREYHGTGILLGAMRPVKADEVPVDWNYGYGEGRVWGEDIKDKIGPAQIR